MFGLSFTELIIIGVVALIVFGPERLPKVLSELGRITGELKKTSDGLRREFYNASYIPADESTVLNKQPSLKADTTKPPALPAENEIKDDKQSD